MNHMSWRPIAETELWDLINGAWDRMDLPQRRLWEALRIDPIKWQQHPYGDQGGGFWVVGLMGSRIIWYNDLEDGFNVSRYSTPGLIDEYWCNQDGLEFAVQFFVDAIRNGT